MHILKALSAMEKGRLVADLSDAVDKVVQASIETGKAGAITLKLKIKATDEESLVIEADLKETMPTPARGSNVFFVDEDGSLTRISPQQPSLFEIEKSGEKTEERTEAVS